MITFKEFLMESRRNPEKNPKLSPFLQLRKIAEKYGTDNVFVRYTATDKIGANPQSQWNTPLGICAYPLKYVIDNLGEVPYAGQNPYMIVFKIKDGSKIWDVSDSVVSSLTNKIPNAMVDVLNLKKLPNYSESTFSSNKNIWRYMYEGIYLTPVGGPSWGKKPGILSRRILTKAGIDGIVDYGTGTIHENEPTQGIFFKTSILDQIDSIKTTYYYEHQSGMRYLARTKQRLNKSFDAWWKQLRHASLTGTIDKAIEHAALHFVKQEYQKFEQVDSIAVELVNYVKKTGHNFPSLIPCLKFSPMGAMAYVQHIANWNRVPELESTIAQGPKQALAYAERVIKGRWPEGESAIYRTQNSKTAYEQFLKELKSRTT